VPATDDDRSRGYVVQDRAPRTDLLFGVVVKETDAVVWRAHAHVFQLEGRIENVEAGAARPEDYERPQDALRRGGPSSPVRSARTSLPFSAPYAAPHDVQLPDDGGAVVFDSVTPQAQTHPASRAGFPSTSA
jgi:hypothetical protein